MLPDSPIWSEVFVPISVESQQNTLPPVLSPSSYFSSDQISSSSSNTPPMNLSTSQEVLSSQDTASTQEMSSTQELSFQEASQEEESSVVEIKYLLFVILINF